MWYQDRPIHFGRVRKGYNDWMDYVNIDLFKRLKYVHRRWRLSMFLYQETSLWAQPCSFVGCMQKWADTRYQWGEHVEFSTVEGFACDTRDGGGNDQSNERGRCYERVRHAWSM